MCLIEAFGMFWYDVPNNLAADAQYYTTSGLNAWNWENHFPEPNGCSFLRVDGQDQDWREFVVGHTYYLSYTGTGEAITFQIIDWIDEDYNNNNCHLRVKIYEYPEPDHSGLTPGFWKNHVDLWAGYSPDTTFADVFGVTITIDNGKNPITNPTLLQALRAKGGVNADKGVYDALARHVVAAILNAAHPKVDYPFTPGQIIDVVSNAITYGTPDPAQLKNQLDDYNNLGGGIDAHGNPI